MTNLDSYSLYFVSEFCEQPSLRSVSKEWNIGFKSLKYKGVRCKSCCESSSSREALIRGVICFGYDGSGPYHFGCIHSVKAYYWIHQ